MSVMIGRCVAGLLCILICPLLTWGTVYIRSGSAIGYCDMKCRHTEGLLKLYRRCGGRTDHLLERQCDNLHTKNYYKTRLHLDTGRGCWKLIQAEKGDSCVYITEYNSHPIGYKNSAEIRVLDPVLISSISSTGGQLCEEMAVSVQFSGEESAVTWEVDGEPLPERYRLIDDNRTLIIPSVQRDDAERRFRVRITNPVSEEIREYRLEIRVPDPVLISNITSNFSRLGEEMAVRVQFSGEESAVTWEVDGEPLPERYRLIDDNRTLIIPSVQRDDTERRFRVRITNPISEEIREYRLINDTMFIRMLETEDFESSRRLIVGLSVGLGLSVTVILVAVLAYIKYQIHSKRRKNRKVTSDTTLNGMENGAVPAVGNGAVPTKGHGPAPN